MQTSAIRSFVRFVHSLIHSLILFSSQSEVQDNIHKHEVQIIHNQLHYHGCSYNLNPQLYAMVTNAMAKQQQKLAFLAKLNNNNNNNNN